MSSLGVERLPIHYMISKEEYLALAAERYEALKALEKQPDFYSYEAEFDKLWVDLGRQVLESSIS